MEQRSADPYEQQLMKVFNSYDVERRGSLDREGLTQLCHSLQLDEEGSELVSCLLKENDSSRATFDEFKEALLALLGNVQKSKPNEDNSGSPDREVSPKYVYGSKKYGRRSRPRSEEITPEKEPVKSSNLIKKTTLGVQKSNSQSDMSFSKKRKTNANLKRCISVPGNCDYEYKNNLGLDNSHFITSNTLNDEFVCTEEMLKAAWNTLGVGKDGYLSQTELDLVCETIGLHELAGGVLRQLSDKVNEDFHRRISFQELLEALQEDDTWSDVFNCTLQSNKDGVSLNTTDADSVFYPNNNMTQYITLGPDGNGLINSDAVIEMWESAGITSPKILLTDLGFSGSDVNITELAAVLEKEIKGMNESRTDYTNPHIALLQAFLTLYQSEIRCLKNILEQMHAEREKLKCDVYEANNRATLLAQEVDENHARMEQTTQNQVKLLEQRHADILKELSEQFNGDKEQMALLNKSLEDRILNLESEETKLQSDLHVAQKYANSLEKENQQLRLEITELQKVKSLLSDEIATLETEKQTHGELEKEQIEPLLSKLSILQVENSKLRDRNDEMICEIENLSSQVAAMRPKISSTPTFNNFDQYSDEISGLTDGVGLGSKRRNGDSPSKDLKAFGIADGSPRLGKVRKFQKNNQLEVPFTSSESGFEPELDWTESSSTSLVEQDETTAQLQARITFLEELLTQHSIPFPANANSNDETMKTIILPDYCRNLEFLLSKADTCQKAPCCTNCDLLKIVQNKSLMSVDVKLCDDSTNIYHKKCNTSTETSPELEDLEKQNIAYKTEVEELNSKVNDLESCVDLLRNEYEKCEDYWASKLDDERQIFEQEQALSSEKLSELIVKIEEYEKQFSSHDDSRLPPIEESFNLESQFNDLEEEYEQYKTLAEIQLEEKNNEIFLLREKLAELTVAKGDAVDAEMQVNMEFRDNKVKNNLSSQVVESTNLFSSDTMPFGWTQSNSQPESLEATIVDAPTENVNSTWSNSKTNNSDIVDGVSLNNSDCSSREMLFNNENTTQSLPLNIIWQNAHQNLKTTSYSMLNLNSTEPAPNGCNSTPCRPKRTRKYDRNPLAHRPQKKNSSSLSGLDKDNKSDSNIPADKSKGLADVTNKLDEQTCIVSVNILHNLNAKVHHLDQRCRHLHMVLKQQHFQAEQMLQHYWQQHRSEKSELQFLLKASHEKLEQQLRMVNEQQDKLARSDMLAKELYVENSYLIANVQRLEQQRNMLIHCNSSNNSV